MASLLSRYLDADTLNRLRGQSLEPKGLVLGNLAGGHRSPMAGFAVEFSGHREYVVGDDPKHIDWRIFHTRDKLFIKQYEMETNFVCHLVLDVSASMRYGTAETQKLAYAARLVTTLAYAIVRQNDKVSLCTLDSAIRGFIPPGQSLVQVQRLIEHLDAIQPQESTDLATTLSELAGRTGRRGIVMIFSDLLTPLDHLEAVLQEFRFRHHEVVLFHVLHPDEREFRLSGMVRFVGLEGEADEFAQAEDIRTAYLAALAEQTEMLESLAQRNSIEFVPIDTGRPPADLLLDYLNRRRMPRRR